MANCENKELSDGLTELKFRSNLLELALYAPEGEITYDGKSALAWAARGVVLQSELVAGLVADIMSKKE